MLLTASLLFLSEVIRLLYAEKEIAMLGQTGSTSLPNKIVMKIPFTDADKKSLENIFVEAQKGVSFWGVQNSSDNPRKNIMTVCLNYKAATDWGMQYLFSASLIYYREKRNGTFSNWVQIK